MLAPPPQGSVFDLVPDGQTNPELYGCMIAWYAYQTLGTTALEGFSLDMAVLNGVPM
jgi:hypothetical protein